MTQQTQKIQGKFYPLTPKIGRLTTAKPCLTPYRPDIESGGLPFDVAVKA